MRPEDKDAGLRERLRLAVRQGAASEWAGSALLIVSLIEEDILPVAPLQ